MLEQLAIQKTLAEKFAELRLKNPSFSLRSYSKKIGLSSSAVSEILNGKRNVSAKLVRRISEGLCLSPRESLSILNLFPKKTNAENGAAVKEYVRLGMDQFNVMSDWYHFAVLSLSETAGYKDKAEWIAARLQISRRVAEQALERLSRMGLMKKDRAGVLRATGEEFSTTDEVSNVALRKSHSQNLELARTSLEEDALEIRDFLAMTMAIDPDRLKEAKHMIREFRDKLCTYLEGGKKKEVYKLCVQLFPLSNKEKTS